MVIAPLLGPNIALALAATLGETPLIWTSLRTNLAGLGLALGLSLIIGLIFPADLNSQELISRTFVGIDSVVLALASGAAAVLSLTTGLSSVLVGVMVAVAITATNSNHRPDAWLRPAGFGFWRHVTAGDECCLR